MQQYLALVIPLIKKHGEIADVIALQIHRYRKFYLSEIHAIKKLIIFDVFVLLVQLEYLRSKHHFSY
jgi:hypothetical protein